MADIDDINRRLEAMEALIGGCALSGSGALASGAQCRVSRVVRCSDSMAGWALINPSRGSFIIWDLDHPEVHDLGSDIWERVAVVSSVSVSHGAT